MDPGLLSLRLPRLTQRHAQILTLALVQSGTPGPVGERGEQVFRRHPLGGQRISSLCLFLPPLIFFVNLRCLEDGENVSPPPMEISPPCLFLNGNDTTNINMIFLKNGPTH